MDYLTLGTTPYEEDCAQVGSEDYYSAAKKEASKYVALLRELFGDERDHFCVYKLKSFPHDFGTYYEVCIVFDDNDAESTQFAYFIEDMLPSRWDMKKEEYTETFSFCPEDDDNVE